MDSSSIEFFYKNVVESSSDDDSDGATEMIMTAARTWDTARMHEVMKACVIMHNMIVDDEHEDMMYDQDWLHACEMVAPAQIGRAHV